MRNEFALAIGVLGLAGLGSIAPAKVVVISKPDTGTEYPLPQVTFDDAKWSVRFTEPPPSGEQFEYVITGDSNDVIGLLHVETGQGSVGLSVQPASGEGTDNGVLRVESLTIGGGGRLAFERFEIEGDLGEDGLHVGGLGVLDVGGSVLGPVVARTIQGPVSVGGDLRGSLVAELGNIGGDIAVGGDIGTDASHRVNIFAQSGLGNISARAMYADIDPGYTTPAADQPIENVVARDGDFAGSLRAGTFEGRFIDIGRDLTASVTFGQPIQVEYRTAIRVGRSFLGTIALPEKGLGLGQITFNYRSQDGVWGDGARVSFGQDAIVLDGPDYSVLPSELGGGAVGLVGFAIHGEACVPAEGSIVRTRPESIWVRFYGQVVMDGSDPLVLERRPIGSNGWMAMPPGCLSVRPAGIDGRSLRVDLRVVTLQDGWEYRARASLAGTDFLRCDLGNGFASPLAGDDQHYVFRVQLACPSDVNDDGRVNGTDLSVVLAAFGNEQFMCGQPGDINGDDATDGSDLVALLAAFGAACPE